MNGPKSHRTLVGVVGIVDVEPKRYAVGRSFASRGDLKFL